MKPRLDYSKRGGALKALLGVSQYAHTSGLESSVLNLVYLRASQLNGCAWCVDMHTKDARAEGESEQRLYLVAAWREAPFYSERERAALAWTEIVTRLPDQGIPDAVYEQARASFNENELIDLTVAITSINAWNRMNVAFRTVAGSYKVGAKREIAGAA
jgi:AhpD family alkylhydroperoxidase